MKTSTAVFLAVAMSLIAAPSALAQAKIKAGTLVCTGGAGVGLILGSKKTYTCSYSPASGAPAERYSASVTKIGLDIGVTGTSEMIWTVLAPTNGVGKHGLSGTYAGATADVAIGVGGGAKVLLGGSNNTVALQPVSVQGQTGLNLAVGVAELSLQ